VLPVLLTWSKNEVLPGTGRTWTLGVNAAVNPMVAGMVNVVVSLAWTAGVV
jgi:hypothetical protein